MKYTQGKYQIAGKRALAKDIFSIDIKCPEITEIACPGQFVHILPPGFTLRRPISICDIDKKSGTLRRAMGLRKSQSLTRESLLICLRLSVTALLLIIALKR